MNIGSSSGSRRGFTIVELLIVIVVIAILAAITVAAYNGISANAQASALQSTLSQNAKALESTKIQSGGTTYPATQSAANLSSDAGTTLTYYPSTDASSFCLQAERGAQRYSITATGGKPSTLGCVDNGLLAWWPLNGNATDASGNGRTGTPTGGSWAVGQNGQANAAHNFTAGSVINFPSVNLANIAFTVTGWMNVATFNNGGNTDQAPLLGNLPSSGQNNLNIHFGVRNLRPMMAYYGSDYSVGPGTMVVGQWYFMAFVAHANGVRQVYLDNTLLGTSASMGLYQRDANQLGNNCCMGGTLNGRLDDVRIYGRPLSTTEVQALYAAGAQ